MLAALIIILFFSLLIVVHELGHFLLAKKFGLFVEEFGLGLPPRIWGRKKGETIYSVNLLPLGGFVKIAGENREEEAADSQLLPERIFYNLKIWKRCLILIGGVAMNFLLGWLLLSAVFIAGIPPAVFITEVSPNSPAAQAGFQVNDKVVGFSRVSGLINFINSSKGKEIAIKVERAGEEIELKAVPRVNPPAGEGALGIGLVESGQERQGILRSFWNALIVSGQIFGLIFVTIFNLVKMAIFGQAHLEGITGPVGIVRVTSQASHLGWVYLFNLMALISINLAAVNIFPFPALDGGRVLFVLIEKIKGSPLPHRLENYANAIGFALLIFLMILITIKDVGGIL